MHLDWHAAAWAVLTAAGRLAVLALLAEGVLQRCHVPCLGCAVLQLHLLLQLQLLLLLCARAKLCPMLMLMLPLPCIAPQRCNSAGGPCSRAKPSHDDTHDRYSPPAGPCRSRHSVGASLASSCTAPPACHLHRASVGAHQLIDLALSQTAPTSAYCCTWCLHHPCPVGDGGIGMPAAVCQSLHHGD